MNDKRAVFSGFFWRFAERCGAQLITFIVSVVLARLLEPEAYGTISLVTVFTTILQVFVDSGLANSLIQKKNADELDFSTVFLFNMIICMILYVVVYLSAPYIALFYHDESLTAIVRVLSLTLLISGIKNVQQAYVSRNMLFKRFFFSTLSGTLFSAVIGIVMAYLGFGVWALVFQQLTNTLVDTLVLWITVKWRPKRQFSIERLKSLFGFGWKLLASQLLDTVYNNLRQLVIGKMYSASDLAHYNRGMQFPNLIVTNINSSIDSVLFPAMSSVQDDVEKVKNMTRRSIKTSIYIMAPLMVGLAVAAPVVVELVLTKKWMPCVPFLRIFCVSFMFYPIHTANLNALKAMGRSDLFLKLEIKKKVVGMILLISTMCFGVMAMAYSLLVGSVICQIINSAPNKKLLRYGYLDQLKDIIPSILLAVFMGFVIGCLKFFQLPQLVLLLLQILIGIAIYVIGSVVLRIDSLMYLVDLLKKVKN